MIGIRPGERAHQNLVNSLADGVGPNERGQGDWVTDYGRYEPWTAANAGPDQTVEQRTAAGTTIALDSTGSTDPDGDTLTCTWRERETVIAGPTEKATVEVSLSLGEHTLTLVVNDGTMDSEPDTVVVTVEDTTAPTLSLPDNIAEVEQTCAGGTYVDFEVAGGGICAAAPVVVREPASGTEFPLGTTTVTVTATDVSGNEATETSTVTVVDTTKPTVALSRTTLWPVDHELVDAGLTISDICDVSPTVELSVTQNEPVDDQTGDGNFSPDAKIVRDAAGKITGLRLRAERKGNGNGRVYLILVTVTDASGNTTQQCCAVTVPKSQSRKDLEAVTAQAAPAVAAKARLPHDSTVGPVVGPKQ